MFACELQKMNFEMVKVHLTKVCNSKMKFKFIKIFLIEFNLIFAEKHRTIDEEKCEK